MSLENELEAYAATHHSDVRELLLRAVSTLRARASYIDDLEATANDAKREVRACAEREELHRGAANVRIGALEGEVRELEAELERVHTRLHDEHETFREQLAEERAVVVGLREHIRELEARLPSIWERLRLW